MNQENRRGNLLLIAAVAVLGLGYGLWVLNVTSFLPTFDDTYEVKAVTPQAANLAPGARVTSAGVKVGRVTDVKRQGIGAVVTLAIEEPSVAPLPRDTVIHVRQRTPVGENYVQIDPGKSGSTIATGDTLPMRQPDDFVELDQVLSTLQGGTRARAQKLIQSLGTAVDGQGPKVNNLLTGANGTLQHLSTLADVVGRDREQIKRLVAASGRIVNAVAERQGAVAELADGGLKTVNALASRDAQLARLLRVLPSTLSQVQTTAGTVGRVTGEATPVVAELATAIDGLRPTVKALRPASQEGREVVRELGRAIKPLNETLGQVRTLSDPTVKALPKLESTLCQANPMLSYIGRYAGDIASAVSNMGSAANSYDAIGHLARVSVVTGENALAGLPSELSKPLAELAHSGLLSETQGMTLDPYPQPGKIGARGLPEKRVLTEEALGQTDYPFERVQAAC